jgi:hypothetical protein
LFLNKDYTAMGQSSKDEQAEKLNNELRYANFNVDNRFNNYKSPYSIGDMRTSLDNVLNGQKSIINQQAQTDIADLQKGAASRMASQGITGGSLYNNTLNQAANSVNKQRYSALQQLGVSRLGQETGLMQDANQDQFRNTMAGQDIDLQNIRNRMSQYGMRSQAIAGMDDTTAWDDMFAGLNAVANPLAYYFGNKK